MIYIIILIIILFCIFLYFQDTHLSVSNYKVIDKKIPEDFNNFKIIQISDFHNVRSNYLKNQIIKRIEIEKPDIIVITGDFIDSNRTNINRSIEFLRKIKHNSKIYYVKGNHETIIDSYKKLRNGLIKNDVFVLENKKEVIKINKSSINIIGINDPFDYDDKNDIECVTKEVNNINYDKKNYTILLSHRPELFNTYVDLGVNLVFTGHAHGGQIRLPFIGGIFSPHQGLFPKYDSGLFKKNNTQMIVSRGIGNSVAPFRINNLPDLVVVTLEKE